MSTEAPFDRLITLAGLDTDSLTDAAAHLGVPLGVLYRLRAHNDIRVSDIRTIAARVGVTPSAVVAALWPDEETDRD